MAKRAVIIYGPPGSGKGTQANLLAWMKNFIHFDTGKYLEQYLNDDKNLDKPGVGEAKKQFDSGVLVEPAFVLKITAEETKEIAKAGYGIVFSGSPRTLFEAFGDNKNEGLISVLETTYGKANIYPVFLKIDPREAIERNKNRRVCSVCANAILYSDETHHHTTCPLCGAKLRQRSVDKPEVLETRIKEYEERTRPIFSELEKRGYKIFEIDATPLPHKVFADIKERLAI